jgi:hypothetical protein
MPGMIKPHLTTMELICRAVFAVVFAK